MTSGAHTLSSSDWSLLRFVGYLLRFHLACDWSRNNKHSRNFLWRSRFYGKTVIFITSVILGELKYFWINYGSCPFAKNLACYYLSELENHIFQNDTFIKPKTLRQQAIRWGPLVSTVVPFPASKHYRLLETAACQPISLMVQDPHRKARFLGLSPARNNRSRLSLLTRTGWIYLRSGCSRSESDVLYSGKSIKNDFTIALFYFFKKH